MISSEHLISDYDTRFISLSNYCDVPKTEKNYTMIGKYFYQCILFTYGKIAHKPWFLNALVAFSNIHLIDLVLSPRVKICFSRNCCAIKIEMQLSDEENHFQAKYKPLVESIRIHFRRETKFSLEEQRLLCFLHFSYRNCLSN